MSEELTKILTFEGVAKHKLDDLTSNERGWKICGYAIEKNGELGLVTTGGFVGWFTVASNNATASEAKVAELTEALKQYEQLLTINAVRAVAAEHAPLWLEAADAAADRVRALEASK